MSSTKSGHICSDFAERLMKYKYFNLYTRKELCLRQKRLYVFKTKRNLDKHGYKIARTEHDMSAQSL